MSPLCDRPGCNGLASATFVYDYQASTAWLEALTLDAHPMAHDLCDHHAHTLIVPRGWARHDRRSVSRLPMFAPDADEPSTTEAGRSGDGHACPAHPLTG